MTSVKTIGVFGGAGNAGALNSVICCVAGAANNAPSMRVAGNTVEGGA